MSGRRGRSGRKPIAYDPRTGHGPEFTRRIVEVLQNEPDLEGWQIEERFGLSSVAVQHYRNKVRRAG